MKKLIAMILASMMTLLTACQSLPVTSSAPTNLIWWVYSAGDIPKDMQKVLDKANAISAEKIGVTVDMRFLTSEQFDLDMTAGEYYDMTFSCDWCRNHNHDRHTERFSGHGSYKCTGDHIVCRHKFHVSLYRI